MLLQACANINGMQKTEGINDHKRFYFKVVAEELPVIDNLYFSETGELFATLAIKRSR